ncbi:MAG: nitroreductase family protein [Acidobacteriota bacterium]
MPVANLEPDTLAAARVEDHRTPDAPIHPLLLRRWSPRAMSGEPIGDDQLLTLFEAARWAPSSINSQPWRFVYARRGTPEWNTFLDLLSEGNREWCVSAAVLLVIASRTLSDQGRPLRTHSFDAGAAWENLALQASALGLVAHGMSGFDYDRARTELGIPTDCAVEAMVAIGKPAPKSVLSEKNQAREKPSGRRPVGELAFVGHWPRG